MYLKSILILAALEQEQKALIDCLKQELPDLRLKKSTLDSKLELEMISAQIGGRFIATVKTGVGSVNAALALYLANQAHPFDSVILLGVGGAVRESLNVGDLIIAEQVLQHDYYYSFDHGDQRIRPGALILSSEEALGHNAEFLCSPDLVAWLKKSESLDENKIFVGTILSGSEFVGRVDRKRAIAQLCPKALLVDMEAAGVAQVAERLNIPFVVAKTVADRLNPDGSIESDFRACLNAACAHAATAMRAIVRGVE